MKLNMTKVCQIHPFPHGLHEFDKTLLNLTVSDTGSSIGQYFFQNHRFRAKKIIRQNSGQLTLTRPIGLPPHAPLAQKIADQR